MTELDSTALSQIPEVLRGLPWERITPVSIWSDSGQWMLAWTNGSVEVVYADTDVDDQTDDPGLVLETSMGDRVFIDLERLIARVKL